jgi:glyoxylase-like metal-dependent hydrolase (beta-lactamase superfamily II)
MLGQMIADGIEAFAARTPTLPPATHTNSYALGTRDVLLVEPATPYDDERRRWLEWARGLVSRGRRPVALFVTHHHVDHVGGTEFLARELSLPVWAHALTAQRLSDVVVARQLSDGDVVDLDGPEPQRWEVLHTPGHAPGHVCLFERGLGAVVVGDMVASVGTILIEPGDGDMRVYLEQLRRLAALSARVALPAHGTPIDEPTQHFEFYVRHRLKREAKVLDALAAGTLDPAQLLAEVYADTPKSVWPIARLSLAAHLDKLLAEGKVLSHDAGYSLNDE